MNNRRSRFLALALCAFSVLIIAASVAPLRAADTTEVRALWVHRASLESEDGIRRAIASATASGFNTLFVRALDETAGSAFDALGETISQAHTAGLKVHAWIDVVRVTAPGELPFARTNVIYQHPEWLMVPRTIAAELIGADPHNPDYLGRLARWTRTNTDRIDGIYISPAQPQAAAYLTELVRDVLRRYAFDGVYLDHVQYPAADFDYGASSLAAFRDVMRGQLSLTERQRIDVVEAIDPFAYPNELPDQWRLFRQTQLTALVARLRSAIKAVRPTAIVSAAVTSDAAVAARDGLQDWRTWAENRFVDALCPKVSAGTAAQIAAQLAQVSALAAGLPVWAPSPSPSAVTRAAVKVP